jgi:hydroxyacylglutathione hydrolase
MVIHSIIGSGYDSNVFVIPGKKTSIIDTGTGMHKDSLLSQISKFVELTSVSQIILTHEHFDHTGGVKQLFEATNKQAKIFAHIAAADKIEKGESLFADLLGGSMPKMPVDEKLVGGESLQIGNNFFTVVSTPGHTPGCLCFYDKQTKTLFSGDTVFANGSFGRTDLPGGNSEELKQSIEKLCELDVINLYPGHEMFIEGNGNQHLQMSLRNVNYF